MSLDAEQDGEAEDPACQILDDGEVAELDSQTFAEILGPHCQIKRCDNNKNVIPGPKGEVDPEEMQREMMAAASAQKRLGAVADHVKTMGRSQKLSWAVDLKDKANEFYAASNFEEAAKLYNDCLCALDLDGTESEQEEVRTTLQLPACTNLAACMIEMGRYRPCLEICDIALSVDPRCAKALYRRGLCHYRLGDFGAARTNFEQSLEEISHQRKVHSAKPNLIQELDNLERRVSLYVLNVRRFAREERASCRQMFTGSSGTGKELYSEKTDVAEKPDTEEVQVDDSDEAIDAALARNRDEWKFWQCCRRRVREKEKLR